MLFIFCKYHAVSYWSTHYITDLCSITTWRVDWMPSPLTNPQKNLRRKPHYLCTLPNTWMNILYRYWLNPVHRTWTVIEERKRKVYIKKKNSFSYKELEIFMDTELCILSVLTKHSVQIGHKLSQICKRNGHIKVRKTVATNLIYIMSCCLPVSYHIHNVYHLLYLELRHPAFSPCSC